MKLAKFLLIFSAVTFVLIACKGAGADTAATDDTTGGGTTDGGGNTPPTTYTVTVDANGGKLGNWKSSTGLALNATVTKPNDADLPTLADNEIAYWSTSPDMYNTEFKFGETQVTGNITIYPHWRWTLDYIKRKMEGDWVDLQTQANGTKIKIANKLFKVNYSNSLIYTCKTALDTVVYNDDDPSNVTNSQFLDKLKSIVIDTTTTPATDTFNPSTYNAAINNYYYQTVGSVYFTYLMNSSTNQGTPKDGSHLLLPSCSYSTTLNYALSNYTSANLNEIAVTRFNTITPGGSKNLILKNYTSLTGTAPEFTLYEEYNGLTHRFVKK